MGWQDTPYTLVLISAASVSAVSGLYLWRCEPLRGARIIAMILFACAAWSVGYSLELGSPTLELKILWAKLQYPGIMAIPVALFVFTLQFSGREQWLTRRNLALLCTPPALSVVLALTNEHHWLFWTDASLVEIGAFSALVFERGIAFWIHTLYGYSLGIGVIAIILQMLVHSVHMYRWQASGLLMLALVPWFSNILYLSSFNPFPHFDLTPIAITMASLVFSLSVSSLRMGDIVAVSREAVIEGMGDAVIVLDAENRIISLNPAGAKALRQPASKLVGQSVREFWTEKWGSEVGRLGVADPGGEIVLPSEDGPHTYDVRSSPLADWRGQLVSRVVVLRDVTERKRAEEALRESEELYRVLVEAVDDTVLVKDADGRYVMVNSEMARRFGRPKDDLIGKLPEDLHPPEQAMRIAADDSRVLTTGVSVDTEEYHPHRPRASIIHTHKAPLHAPDGRIIGLVGVGRDVTEHKRLEEQLLRAQRMETAGRVAGQVAHDFNNLLSPMIAYPELIKAQLPDGHPALDYCDAMLEAAERMVAINEDMMALGRRGHFDRQPVDLNQLVKDAVGQMVGAPETLAVQLGLVEDILPASGSPAQLLRVVVNLISNAREAMGDRGTLTIRTENLYVENPIGYGERLEKGEYVRLQVADTGCGIPVEIQDKIFDAFFTTKTRARRRGCGLGLSIVQSIVGDHKGYVEMESEVGRGTTFNIYLPICRDLPDVTAPEELRGGAEKVLVVDDDRLQREVERQLLERLGYKVVEAASGEEALAYLAEHPVDLLLLDMIMASGIDGAETYRRVLELRPGTPAIIVSGFSQSDRVQEAQRLGASAYVRKSVRLEMLAKAVREELDRK